jgi:BMFP domain-containing protein YqiC
MVRTPDSSGFIGAPSALRQCGALFGTGTRAYCRAADEEYRTVQTKSRLLDDLARLANSAAGMASGLREEIETLVHQRIDRVLADHDLVRREEFEAVEAVAIRAREAQEALEKRVAELEAKLAQTRKRKPAAKPAEPADHDDS